MNADLSDSIKRLVKKGKENGFVLISELDEIIKNLKVADQQYIRDGLEELEIQIVKTPKDYDEYKYMTGEQAIEFFKENESKLLGHDLLTIFQPSFALFPSSP